MILVGRSSSSFGLLFFRLVTETYCWIRRLTHWNWISKCRKCCLVHKQVSSDILLQIGLKYGFIGTQIIQSRDWNCLWQMNSISFKRLPLTSEFDRIQINNFCCDWGNFEIITELVNRVLMRNFRSNPLICQVPLLAFYALVTILWIAFKRERTARLWMQHRDLRLPIFEWARGQQFFASQVPDGFHFRC